MLTVAELIKELEKIEDKEKGVIMVYDGGYCDPINKVEEWSEKIALKMR